MIHPKPKRVNKKKIRDQIKQMPCVICNSPPPNDPDHIRSVGAGGEDTLDGLWSLCRGCHILRHKIGLNALVNKYFHLIHVLESKGWVFMNGKLVRK